MDRPHLQDKDEEDVMNIVFDLDGVLIDSESTVRAAYEYAGVTPPFDVLAYEGVPWIAEQIGEEFVDEVKKKKNEQYLYLLSQRLHTFPAYATACLLSDEGYHTSTLTGAPDGIEEILNDMLPIWPFDSITSSMKTYDKMSMMREAHDVQFIYIDDNTRNIEELPNMTFVHYAGQDSIKLYDTIHGIIKESM